MPMLTPSYFYLGWYWREHLFYEHRTTASSRYPPEKLLRKFLKNSPENTYDA